MEIDEPSDDGHNVWAEQEASVSSDSNLPSHNLWSEIVAEQPALEASTEPAIEIAQEIESFKEPQQVLSESIPNSPINDHDLDAYLSEIFDGVEIGTVEQLQCELTRSILDLDTASSYTPRKLMNQFTRPTRQFICVESKPDPIVRWRASAIEGEVVDIMQHWKERDYNRSRQTLFSWAKRSSGSYQTAAVSVVEQPQAKNPNRPPPLDLEALTKVETPSLTSPPLIPTPKSTSSMPTNSPMFSPLVPTRNATPDPIITVEENGQEDDWGDFQDFVEPEVSKREGDAMQVLAAAPSPKLGPLNPTTKQQQETDETKIQQIVDNLPDLSYLL